MINLEFTDAAGGRLAVEYDVHPRSQEAAPIPVPAGAAGVTVWLGTVPLGVYAIQAGDDNGR